jgi:Putative metallopeptidase
MKSSRLFNLICLIALLFCFSCNDTPATEQPSSSIEIRYTDKGDFRPIYQFFRTNDPAKPVIDKLRNEGLVTNLVNQLNSYFKLPHDVMIRFRQSDTSNAWYDPNTKSIDFTSAFIFDFYDKFKKYYSGQELTNKVTSVIMFFLLHEIGHAVIDIYDISVKGPEEDMADYFAVYLLSQGDDAIQSIAMFGAQMFLEFSKDLATVPLNQLPLWDEHSLEPQRFYHILCLMYGKDPNKYSYIVTRNLLPIRRADRCGEEYDKMMRGWDRDLNFYKQTPVK